MKEQSSSSANAKIKFQKKMFGVSSTSRFNQNRKINSSTSAVTTSVRAVSDEDEDWLRIAGLVEKAGRDG